MKPITADIQVVRNWNAGAVVRSATSHARGGSVPIPAPRPFSLEGNVSETFWERFGISVSSFSRGQGNGIGLQITTDTGYVQLSKEQVEDLVVVLAHWASGQAKLRKV